MLLLNSYETKRDLHINYLSKILEFCIDISSINIKT